MAVTRFYLVTVPSCLTPAKRTAVGTTDLMPVPQQRRGQLQRRGRHRRRRQMQPCVALLACCWLAVAEGWALTSWTSGANRLQLCNHQGRRRCLRPRTAATAASSAAAGVAAMAADGPRRKRLVVIGGGAAGYFGAIQAAASSSELEVVVLEAGRLPLQKVKISGGGRCNVMHDTSKAVSLIAKGYPRGSKQLMGPFKSIFGPEDAAAWFRSRGVRLKTEGDGRMFPVTDDSQTVIDCLEGAARKASVQVVTSARVSSIIQHGSDSNAATISVEAADATAATAGAAGPLDVSGADVQQQSQPKPQTRFEVKVTTTTPLPPAMRKALGAASTSGAEPAAAGRVGGGEAGTRRNGAAGIGESEASGKRAERGSYVLPCDYVLQATGAAREGHGWAKGLGHAVSAPVPSLFTLTIKDPRLEGLSGLSVQDAELKLFAEEKPVNAAAGGVRHSASGDGGSADIAEVAEITGGGAEGGVPGGEAGTSETPPASNDRGNIKKGKKKRAKKQPAVTQRGPLLITHTGVSGPAALKLSAFGARVLNEGGYRGKLVVNWMAGNNPSKALDDLQAFRTKNPKKTVHSFCPVVGSGAGAAFAGPGGRSQPSSSSTSAAASNATLPRRLWQSLALASGVAAGDKWADVSKAKLSALAQQLTACELQIVGKGSFKEEFVTCGGVALSALDMRTMESKTVPGLFFAGEVVDVDGVTGGFNFQSAWTTGWVAGTAIAAATAAATAPADEVEESRADELLKQR